MKKRIAAPAVGILLALMAAGCGGGSSSDPSPAPAPTPAPPSAPPAGTIPPVASNSCQAFPGAGGADVVGTLAGSASSPASRTLTFSVVAQPQLGAIRLTPAGAFTYTRSDPGRGNLDSFTFRVTDSEGLTADARAQIIYGSRRIMPLGDSITDGVETYTDAAGNFPAVASRVGYRKALYERLTSQGYAVDMVGSQRAGAAAGLVDPAHEGYPGYTQADLVSGIDGWLAGSPPDVVLLHIGTNDVNQGNTSAAATSDLLSRIGNWSASTSNPPVQLLLATIVPQQVGAANARGVQTFNDSQTAIYNRDWADPAGARPRFVVRQVDMNSKLQPATDLSSLAVDSVGLHPNPTGYGKMADTWYNSLVESNAVFKCQ